MVSPAVAAFMASCGVAKSATMPVELFTRHILAWLYIIKKQVMAVRKKYFFINGRIEVYKTQSGQDKKVMDFLEQQTEMLNFLNGIYSIIDISVSEYIKRDFKNLMVNFGCTGGQHRSVHATDALARHLRNKFGVKTEVKHLVQDAKNWINE